MKHLQGNGRGWSNSMAWQSPALLQPCTLDLQLIMSAASKAWPCSNLHTYPHEPGRAAQLPAAPGGPAACAEGPALSWVQMSTAATPAAQPPDAAAARHKQGGRPARHQVRPQRARRRDIQSLPRPGHGQWSPAHFPTSQQQQAGGPLRPAAATRTAAAHLLIFVSVCCFGLSQLLETFLRTVRISWWQLLLLLLVLILKL